MKCRATDDKCRSNTRRSCERRVRDDPRNPSDLLLTQLFPETSGVVRVTRRVGIGPVSESMTVFAASGEGDGNDGIRREYDERKSENSLEAMTGGRGLQQSPFGRVGL